MSVPPQSTQVVKASTAAPQDLRVIALAPYFQAHTRRLTAWKVSGGLKTELLDAYDYKALEPVYFDAEHTNSAPDADAGKPGAFAGSVELKAGDEVQWECEIDNDTDTPIGFGRTVHSQEMCLLLGFYSPSDGRTWMAVK